MLLTSQIFVENDALKRELIPFLAKFGRGDIFFLVDQKLCSLHNDMLAPLLSLAEDCHVLFIEAGEEHKDIEGCKKIWDFLNMHKATRKSVLVNVGGGVLTDMGGFAASVYKRGIRTIHVPTTLMGMVDASIGGKTAVDYHGIKNLLGAFHMPLAVVGDSGFLSTLSRKDLLSGFAEIVKHALLIGGEMWYEVLRFDPLYAEIGEWQHFINLSMKFKSEIVEEDPKDEGRRKILNLGHTVGHAVESYLIERDLPLGRVISHGEAVMIGLLCETYLSTVKLKFPSEKLHQLVYLSKSSYSPWLFSCKEYDKIVEYALQDKKNTSDQITFVAMNDLAQPLLMEVTEEDVKESLDFYREVVA